jgi:hypothetical protein
MISKAKKYFTFFGMMAATVDKKLQTIYSKIEQLNIIVPNIEARSHFIQLQPIQTKNKIEK